MRRNPTLDAVVAELEAAGVQYIVRNGRKHLKVCWLVTGHQRRVMTVSRIASSEWHSALAAKTDVRRMLRTDGIDRR
jgi:hypothetical protein